MEVLISPEVEDKLIIGVSDLRRISIVHSTFPKGNLGSNSSKDEEEEKKNEKSEKKMYVTRESESIWGIKIKQVVKTEEDPYLTETSKEEEEKEEASEDSEEEKKEKVDVETPSEDKLVMEEMMEAQQEGPV